MTLEERIEIEKDGNSFEWTKEQFNEYLDTKNWDEEIKSKHRRCFEGYICFIDGQIQYYKN